MNNNTKLYIRNKWIYHTPLLKLDECVDNAMDEYSKEVALDFDEWKREHEYVLSSRYPNKWYENIYDAELTYYTNEQLFELYKKENT